MTCMNISESSCHPATLRSCEHQVLQIRGQKLGQVHHRRPLGVAFFQTPRGRLWRRGRLGRKPWYCMCQVLSETVVFSEDTTPNTCWRFLKYIGLASIPKRIPTTEAINPHQPPPTLIKAPGATWGIAQAAAVVQHPWDSATRWPSAAQSLQRAATWNSWWCWMGGLWTALKMLENVGNTSGLDANSLVAVAPVRVAPGKRTGQKIDTGRKEYTYRHLPTGTDNCPARSMDVGSWNLPVAPPILTQPVTI